MFEFLNTAQHQVHIPIFRHKCRRSRRRSQFQIDYAISPGTMQYAFRTPDDGLRARYKSVYVGGEEGKEGEDIPFLVCG